MLIRHWTAVLFCAILDYQCGGDQFQDARRYPHRYPSTSWDAAKEFWQPMSNIHRVSKHQSPKIPGHDVSEEDVYAMVNIEHQRCARPTYPRCPVIRWEPDLLPGLCRVCETDAQCCMGRKCCDIGSPTGKCCVNPTNDPRCPDIRWTPKIGAFCHTCSDDVPCQVGKVCCNYADPEGRSCCMEPIPEQGIRVPKNFVLHEDKSTYEDAERVCHLSGQRLAVIRDNQTQSLVLELLAGSDLESDVWIGLKSVNEMEFVWADGHILAANKSCGHYQYWQQEEPNDHLTHRGTPTCVRVTFPPGPEAVRGRWYDDNCAKPMYFLCEEIVF